MKDRILKIIMLEANSIDDRLYAVYLLGEMPNEWQGVARAIISHRPGIGATQKNFNAWSKEAVNFHKNMLYYSAVNNIGMGKEEFLKSEKRGYIWEILFNKLIDTKYTGFY